MNLLSNIGNAVMTVFNFIIDAGPTVLLPVIITIVGLIFGLSFTRSFRAGLTVAIGYIGIRLILNFMTGQIGPAAQLMVQRTGVQLDALDVGWGAIAAVTWASPIIAFLIFSIFLVNIIMLTTKTTNTLNVDIWNYHHIAIVGVLVHAVTQSIPLGILSSAAMAVVTFKFADWSQKDVEEAFGIPGVTFPTVSATSSLVIAWPLNWLLDKIPFFRNSTFKVENAARYLGFFGDSMIIGLLLGMIIGFLAGYDVTGVIQLGIDLSAVLIIIPRMTALFVEGIMPISEAAQTWVTKKFENRKIFIGLDAAVIVGNENVITTALILIPITILMALIIPGNRVMPAADLGIITFRVAMVIAVTRGNFLKDLIIGGIVTASVLLCATNTTELITSLAVGQGIETGGLLISSFSATSLIQSWLVFKAFTWNPFIAIPIFIAVFLAAWYYFEKVKKVTTYDLND